MSCTSSSNSVDSNQGLVTSGLLRWSVREKGDQVKFAARCIAGGRILSAYAEKESVLDLSGMKIGPDLPPVLQYLSGLKFLDLKNTDVTEIPCLPQECRIVWEEQEKELEIKDLSQMRQEHFVDKCSRWCEQVQDLDPYSLFGGL